MNYIFTDKTGTLTANLMKFRSLSAGFYSYGSLDQHQNREGIRRQTTMGENFQYVDFVDNTLLDDLSNINSENYFYLR